VVGSRRGRRVNADLRALLRRVNRQAGGAEGFVVGSLPGKMGGGFHAEGAEGSRICLPSYGQVPPTGGMLSHLGFVLPLRP